MVTPVFREMVFPEITCESTSLPFRLLTRIASMDCSQWSLSKDVSSLCERPILRSLGSIRSDLETTVILLKGRVATPGSETSETSNWAYSVVICAWCTQRKGDDDPHSQTRNKTLLKLLKPQSRLLGRQTSWDILCMYACMYRLHYLSPLNIVLFANSVTF